jgi:hypothetical protein
MNFTDFYNSAQSAVSYATTFAEVLLLIRLASLGLIWEFKIFSFFVAFDAAFTVALAGLDYHGYGYERIWTVTTPLWTLLLAGASVELSRGLRQPFPREKGNRAVAFYGFLIGMSVSVGASMWTHPQAIIRSAALLMNIGRTSMLCGCVLALVAQGAYLMLGSAPFVANWQKHRRILLTYITAFLMASFTINSKNRHFAEWISLLSNVSLFGCFCVWTLGLQRMFHQASDFCALSVDERLAEIIIQNRRGMAHGVRSAVDTASTT